MRCSNVKTEKIRVWFDRDINAFNGKKFEPKQGVFNYNGRQAEYLLALKDFLQQHANFVTQFNQAYSVFQQNAVTSVKQTMLRLINKLLSDSNALGMKSLAIKTQELHDAIEQNEVTGELVEQVDELLIETTEDIEQFLQQTCGHQESLPSVSVLSEDRWQLLLQTEQLLLEQSTDAFELILRLYLYQVSSKQELLLDRALVAVEKENFREAITAIALLKGQLQ